jgi:16S rRNA (cytosine967-C5)-methyltransferase
MRQTQRELLERAAAWARPGGRLLWCTCSPTRAENEGVIEPWLARNRQWRQIPPAEMAESADLLPWVQAGDLALRTRPDLVACDGFSYICLEKI